MWLIWTIFIMHEMVNVKSSNCKATKDGDAEVCQAINDAKKCENTEGCEWKLWFKKKKESQSDYAEFVKFEAAVKKALAGKLDGIDKIKDDLDKNPLIVKAKKAKKLKKKKKKKPVVQDPKEIKSATDEVKGFNLITFDKSGKITQVEFDASVKKYIEEEPSENKGQRRLLAMTDVTNDNYGNSPYKNVGQIHMKFWKPWDANNKWQHYVVDMIYNTFNQFNNNNPIAAPINPYVYGNDNNYQAAMAAANRILLFFQTDYETNAAFKQQWVYNIWLARMTYNDMPQQQGPDDDTVAVTLRIMYEIPKKYYGGEYVGGNGVGTIIEQKKVPSSNDYYVYVLTNGHVVWHKHDDQHNAIPANKRANQRFEFVHVNKASNDRKTANANGIFVIPHGQFDKAWCPEYTVLNNQVDDWAIIRWRVNAKIAGVNDKLVLRVDNRQQIACRILTYDYHVGEQNRMRKKDNDWNREQWMSLKLSGVDADYKEGMSGSSLFSTDSNMGIVGIFRGQTANNHHPIAVRITNPKKKSMDKILQGKWNNPAQIGAHVEYENDIDDEEYDEEYDEKYDDHHDDVDQDRIMYGETDTYYVHPMENDHYLLTFIIMGFLGITCCVLYVFSSLLCCAFGYGTAIFRKNLNIKNML